MSGNGLRLLAEVGDRRGFWRRAGWQDLEEPLRSLVPEICNPLLAIDPKAADAQARSGLGKEHLSVPVGTAQIDRAAAEERAKIPTYSLSGRFLGLLMQTCHLHFPAKLTGKVPDHIWRGQWVTLWGCLLAPFFFSNSCDEGPPWWSSG